MLPSPPSSLLFSAATRINLCRWLTYLIADDYEMAIFCCCSLIFEVRPSVVACLCFFYFFLLACLQLILLLSACNYNCSNILIVSWEAFSIEFTAPKFHSKYCNNEAIKYEVFHNSWNLQCGGCNTVELFSTTVSVVSWIENLIGK